MPRSEIPQHERGVWAAARARGVKQNSPLSHLAGPFRTGLELGRDAEVALAVTGHYMLVFPQSRSPIFSAECCKLVVVRIWFSA